MKSANGEEKDLSAGERLVMKVIWEAGGELSFMELRERLNKNYGKAYSRNTVATFLSRMEEKGFVENYRIGKNAHVRAIKEREAYTQELLRETSDFWFSGSACKLASALFQKDKVSKEEIREMRRILDELDD